jgi:hypothetical protein
LLNGHGYLQKDHRDPQGTGRRFSHPTVLYRNFAEDERERGNNRNIRAEWSNSMDIETT